MHHVGIILLDGAEVLVRMYETDNIANHILLHSENRDLTSFKQGKLLMKSTDFIEVIAEVSFAGYSLRITDWKICARNLPESIVKDVALATGMSIEKMTLAREQELLCKGVLSEF